MNRRLTGLQVFGFAVLAVPAALALFAEPPKKSPGIKTEMSKMKDGLKALSKDLADPKKTAACLDTVMSMEDAMQMCKLNEPPTAAKLEKEEKAKNIAEYKKALIGVQRDLLDLETAILDNDMKKAQELADKVASDKGPAHEKFNPRK